MKCLHRFQAVAVMCLIVAGCGRNDSSITINVGGKMIKGSGVLLEEKRNVPEFSIIDLSGNYRAVVKCGLEQEVRVSADDNIVPHIKTVVTGSVLKVSLDQSVSTKNKITLNISLNSLSSIRSSGSVSADVSHLKAESLELNISGTGNINLEGVSDGLRVKMSGAGKVDAKKLAVKEGHVEVNGAGSVVVSVSDELIAIVNGIGSIDYYGNPGEVRKKISGLGRIKKR